MAVFSVVVGINACGSSEDEAAPASGGASTGGVGVDASIGGAAGVGGTGAIGGTSGSAGTAASAGKGGVAGSGAEGGVAGSGGLGGSAGAGATDAGADSGSGGTPGTHKTSLKVCWTDPTCPRVFAVAHGGLWSLTGAPYDSDAAIAAAYAADVDAVKIDVRVTKDNVPVIAHSSPIEIFESVNCYNKKIEEMNAVDVTKCIRVPSLTEKFQRLDDVLKYLKGKMIVQLTVKESTDYARTIAEVHAQGAEEYAFLEISTNELQNLIPTLPGADSIYYLINVKTNLTEVDTLIKTIKNPRAFMYEFEPTVDVSSLTPNTLHPAGVRSFTYTNAPAPTQGQLQALFEGGFDAVSSQNAGNCVAARKIVNAKRGVSPP
ncbi:MAG: glycerophosphodiester phosphodiesterase family protein [Polyangiaceae bacterium]